MPFCPICKDEFREYVKVCPDCQTLLVDNIPQTEVSEKIKDPLVHIATAPNELVANIWKDILAENGLESLLQSINPLIYMYTGHMTRQIKIFVLDRDAQKAREILLPFTED